MSESVSLSSFVCPSVCLCVTFCLSPGDKQFVCPPGDKHFLHTGEGGGTNISHTQGGTNIFTLRGGQTFFVGGGGGFDDVEEEIDVSEAKFS